LAKRLGQLANVAWGQIAVALTALAGIRLYTEILGPRNYGAAMLVLGAIAFLDSLGVLALSQTLLTRCGPHSDYEGRRQVSIGLSWVFLKWMAPLGAIAGLAIAIAVVLAGGDATWLILSLIIPLYVAAETAKTSLLSLVVLDRRYTLYSAWIAAEAILTLLGIIATLLLWRADALAFLTGLVVSRLVCAAVFILCASPRHLSNFRRADATQDIRPALSYGIPVAMMGPLGWVSTYLDRYILGAVLGASTTGVYVAVTGLVARPYGLITSVLTNFFRPLYFQPDVIRDGRQSYSRILRRWVLTALCIGLVGTIALAFAGKWIVQLALAPEFRQGAVLLMILYSISQTCTIITHAADNALLALQQSRRLLRAQVYLSITTLAFIPLGIAIGGVVGGVIGRCVAEAAKLAVVMVIAISAVRRSSAAAPATAEHGRTAAL
jgi:O-antigen/teichoic acid export membrane protein